jgi:ABC-2 type transport system ATP-binding protein
MVKVENLIFDYQETRALDNISFNIPEGSITALVGPNGAGKTTLLKCLSSLYNPFSGTIFIDGINIIDKPLEIRKSIGYLQDYFGLYDDLTVKQALAYVYFSYKCDPSQLDNRIIEVAYQLKISEKLNSKISFLSRGYRQRLAIAQAIIHSPKLLLLDEPASGLDPESRNSLSQLFLELNKEGMTIIVSSHILAELDQYANNILILRNGKITESEVEELKSDINDKLLLIHFNYPIDNIDELLRNEPLIKKYEIDGFKIKLLYSGDVADQHQLLKKLIDNGLPVAQFYSKQPNIQDYYLKKIDEEQL